MVKLGAFALSLVLSGCVLRTTRARDATLHYHPTLDELRARTPQRPSEPPIEVAVHLGRIASGYPQPVGLAYSSDGAFRKVVGVEWSNGEVETALANELRARLRVDEQSPSHLGGGLVSLAVYRFGGTVYGSALLEVRLLRAGNEIFGTRYRVRARGHDRSEVLATLASELAEHVSRDPELRTALGGAP